MLIDSISPGLFAAAAGLICTALPKKFRKPAFILAALYMLLQVVQLELGTTLSYELIPGMFVHPLNVDKLSYAFGFTYGIFWLAGAFYASVIERRSELLAVSMYISGVFGVVFAGDLLAFIFFWELVALSAMCIVYQGDSVAARRASFRYMINHMISGNMMLAGVVIKYSQGFTGVSSLSDTPHDLGFWLLLGGLLLDAAMPPLHAWAPDSYPEAPIPGSVFQSACTTKLAAYCIIRLFPGTEILIYIGLFAAVYGVVYALLENDMRRLLSYHITSQVGFMVAAAGIGTELALDGAAAFSMTNIVYKSLLFMCAGAVIYATGKRKITDLGGVFKQMPYTASCMLIAGLAIAGVPLFSGFASKSLILSAASESGHTAAELILTLAGIGSFLSITLKMTWFIFFGEGRKEPPKIIRPVPVGMKIGMGIETFMCVLYGIRPSALYDLLPGMPEAHLYNVDHLTEYGEMLALSVLVFVLFLPKMKPHDEMSLDIDWLYRKPVFELMRVSEMFVKAGAGVRGTVLSAASFMASLSHNPVHVFFPRKDAGLPAGSKGRRDPFKPDFHRAPSGGLIMVILAAMVLMMVMFFVIMKTQ